MARPKKAGLDYFPFDVNFFEDDKLQLIEAEFGVKGVMVAVRLLCKIYKENGYYYQWGEDECLLFSRNAGAEFVPQFVNEVVSGLVRRSFFDKRVFDTFGILTSKGIQKRFFEAIERRKRIEVFKELIVIENINSFNVDINSINVSNNPQSKVKESKVKNIGTNVPVETDVSPTEDQLRIKDLKDRYKTLSKDKRNIYGFIRDNNPPFIEPYVALWNSWASERGKPKVEDITDKRRGNFNARMKEKRFNFITILAKASKSQMLLTSSWFTYDWFMKSKDNYLKILEGNYDDQPNPNDKKFKVNEADEAILRLSRKD